MGIVANTEGEEWDIGSHGRSHVTKGHDGRLPRLLTLQSHGATRLSEFLTCLGRRPHTEHGSGIVGFGTWNEADPCLEELNFLIFFSFFRSRSCAATSRNNNLNIRRSKMVALRHRVDQLTVQGWISLSKCPNALEVGLVRYL